MKRFFDLVLACLMTILLLPVFLIVAVLVKVSSKGPVIFTQKRVGKDCKSFNIYKFRTMYVNTPDDICTRLLDNPKRYITPVGWFLRKSSLDELPQLINIIKGEMSFVGPRPPLYNERDLIDLRERYRVNSVKPGLTGWAQISGRDVLPVNIKARFDRYYVENMSFWLDTKILFFTIFRVIFAHGVVEGRYQRKPKLKTRKSKSKRA